MPCLDNLPTNVLPQIAKRCQDYDSECIDIVDKASCYCGGVKFIGNVEYVLDMVDGYCPYIIGMSQE